MSLNDKERFERERLSAISTQRMRRVRRERRIMAAWSLAVLLLLIAILLMEVAVFAILLGGR